MSDMGETTDLSRVQELRCALDAADYGAATAIISELREAGSTEHALDALAEYAPAHRRALELLIEALDESRIVHRFAGRMLLDQNAIEDVAQDALISIVESIGSFRRGAKFTSWVYPIVQRRVADYLRKHRASVPLDEEPLPGERMSSMIAARATVQQALASLPELYREPVVMRDIDGLSYGQIAEHLGRSLNTVKSHISRGRAMVAVALRENAE